MSPCKHWCHQMFRGNSDGTSRPCRHSIVPYNNKSYNLHIHFDGQNKKKHNAVNKSSNPPARGEICMNYAFEALRSVPRIHIPSILTPIQTLGIIRSRSTSALPGPIQITPRMHFMRVEKGIARHVKPSFYRGMHKGKLRAWETTV